MGDIASDTQIPQHPISPSDLLALERDDDTEFDRLARAAYESQLLGSRTYGSFAGEASGVLDAEWRGWKSVPFLPVEAFKWPGIVGFSAEDAEAVFLSSSTGSRRSSHPVLSTAFYDLLATTWFEACVAGGPIWFLAHLPTYQTLGDESSLIHMVKALIARFGTPDSQIESDENELRMCVAKGLERGRRQPPLILFGTAFGLMDMIEEEPFQLPSGSLVIETGGMKFRRREIDRSSLHNQLAEGFRLPRTSIRSEYGMCEMLSQHYTRGGEVFESPPWVRFKVVDRERPEREVDHGRSGLLAVFDLANCHSVSPILTADLVRARDSGFEVLGRVNDAELRGCNFLFDQEL